MLTGLLASVLMNAGELRVPEGVLTVGRWGVVNSYPAFQWPASGFRVKFKGTGLRATLVDSADGSKNSYRGLNSNSLAVRVDGGEFKTVWLRPGKVEYELVADLKSGAHLVEVFKRTESSVGSVSLVKAAPIAGDMIGVGKDDKPLLEFYGDSNSVGYGIEEDAKEKHYSPETANATVSHSFLAAQTAGYELSLIAASGWGIMRGYGGEPQFNIPAVFDRTFIDKDEGGAIPGRKPDVIVVMLGDNDFAKGDPGEAFDVAYRAFVKALRKRAPSARIILGVGAQMQDTATVRKRSRVGGVIDGIVRESGDPLIERLDYPLYDSSWGYGADWHYSQRACRQLSQVLVDALKLSRG